LDGTLGDWGQILRQPPVCHKRICADGQLPSLS
jgi:hypothetical protein